MQNYEQYVPLEAILSSPNVAEHLTENDRQAMGKRVVENFEMDRISRLEWEQRMEKASKLALQVAETKTFPWPGASNVKFPLITIAALQYHSRAYPALITTPDVVHCITVGEDPDGKKNDAARRVSEHMSWQLLEEDEGWEAEEDKALLVQALMGMAIKKTYFDRDLNRNVSELVLPQDFVVSYFTKNVKDSPRSTHILSWTHNDLESKMRLGLIFPTDTSPPKVVPMPFGQLAELKDRIQGLTVPSQDPEQPFIVLEQHTCMDLDGDGYKEPYVIFVRYDNQQLLRILPSFFSSGIKTEPVEGKEVVTRITPEQYFTQRVFIPSPDGGFYGLGFGHLLGPLNESIDTAINQLFDAGTMHNAGGGFLGRGARFKSGDISFRPNEWKRVESSGDDLRKSIVELPMREPSQVLFNLLSLLIDYGQRVAGAPEVVQGQNPGQNTPAETSRTMLEQGIKVFTGIYKRTYRALRDEFKKIYRLNQLYLEDTTDFVSQRTGLPVQVLVQDYKLPSSSIRPAADPNYMSDAQRMNQARAVMEASLTSPGYDLYEVNKQFLAAWKVPNIDKVLPPPGSPNAPKPKESEKITIEKLKIEQQRAEMEQALRVKLFELMEEHDVNRATIIKMEAEAVAELEGIQDTKLGHVVGLVQTQIQALKLKQEGRIRGIEILRDLIELNAKNKEKSDEPSRVAGLARGSTDPGVLRGVAESEAGVDGSVGRGFLH